MKSTYKYLRNHIITGFIFLMPVLISIVVVSKFWSKLLIAGKKASKLIHTDTRARPFRRCDHRAYNFSFTLYNGGLPG